MRRKVTNRVCGRLHQLLNGHFGRSAHELLVQGRDDSSDRRLLGRVGQVRTLYRPISDRMNRIALILTKDHSQFAFKPTRDTSVRVAAGSALTVVKVDPTQLRTVNEVMSDLNIRQAEKEGRT